MEREEKAEIYTIPPNFAEEGTLFSGRIRTRNAIETGILLAVLLPLLASLELPVKAKLYIGMIVLVPVVVLAVLGVQGESLFAFIAGFLMFVRRRRYLALPDEKYRLLLNRKREKAWRGGKKDAVQGGRKTPNTGMETGAKRGAQGGKGRQKKPSKADRQTKAEKTYHTGSTKAGGI